MNIREYIISKYRENPALAGYDLSEGTNIYDLVIAPLSFFFEDALGSGEIRLASEMREWDSLSELTLDEIKNIARMNYIEPAAKSESTTLITLHFTSPVEWTIPAGAKLSYGQAIFAVRDEVVITEKILLSNLDSVSGLYRYGGIYVTNEHGDSVPQNTLGYMDGAPAELVKITHPAATNGVVDDDKPTLINKMRRRALSITGGGVNSITALINALYPGVGVDVVAPGDERMRRDIVYNLVSGDSMPVMESNYRGKIRGTVTYNKSMAYMTTLTEDEMSAAFSPESAYEFAQGHYLAITDDVDSVATMSTGNILYERFTQSSEKIGNTSALTGTIAIGDRDISVANGSLYGPGDIIQIVDRTGATPTQGGVVESVNTNELTLYNNLSIAVDYTTNMFVDIVNAEGLYIGPGWIKSEHEMPIGTFINENEASVVGGELMLGMKFEGEAPNVMKQVFLRYGVRKMIENLVRYVKIESMWDSNHMEEIYTEPTQNER
jgi:hypothetical protein